MYGQFRFTIDLSDTVAEISAILKRLKGRDVPYDETIRACAHYKQLALVCACAFMMSPIGAVLREEKFNLTKIRNMLVKEVQNVYPMFATGQDEWWGSDSVLAVVTELGATLLADIVLSAPKMKSAFGMPTLYIFVPSHVEETPSGTTMTFILHCRPPVGATLLSAS